MKNDKTAVTNTVARLTSRLPRHPCQDDLLQLAVKLLAEDVVKAATADQPVTEAQALAGATAEFETGLTALAFDPTADRFIAVYASADWSGLLAPYLKAAWQSAPELCGQHPPQSFEPKRAASSPKQQH